MYQSVLTNNYNSGYDCMMKEIMRTVRVCDDCQGRDFVVKCSCCGKDLCSNCSIRIDIKRSTDWKCERYVCEECKQEVYGRYLQLQEEIKAASDLFRSRIAESDKELDKINSKLIIESMVNKV